MFPNVELNAQQEYPIGVWGQHTAGIRKKITTLFTTTI